MSERKKRRAEDQLSPYSNPVEEDAAEAGVDAQMPVNRKRAKAVLGGVPAAPESLKGILSAVNILRPVARSDRISGLNRCFLRAIQTVIEAEANKDLSYLFRQYEKYYKELSSDNSQNAC